jgi:hypothetical protein
VSFPHHPKHDVADIVRAHRQDLEKQHRLSRPQKRVLTAISRCRTAALGGHLEVCTGCGREHPVYNSCRNRHCPKCQALAQQRWIDARAERILPIPHFHVVFTPPSELRPLAMRHPTEVYTALFRSVSEVLMELGRTHLKAVLGLTMVLHTWTRDLRFHPHIHVLVTAGGLALNGSRFVLTQKSRKTGKEFLFDVKVMGRLLRGKMLDALRQLHRKGAFPEMSQAAFNHLMASLAAHKSWVVYAKEPFKRSQHVLSYLGRYTHRVGIANSRLVDVGSDHVTFRTKHEKTATLHPVEFLRRLVQHVLPNGFHKIRHAGLYASAQPGGSLEKARALLPAPKPREEAQSTPRPTAQDAPRICTHCGAMILRLPLNAMARSPPLVAACA